VVLFFQMLSCFCSLCYLPQEACHFCRTLFSFISNQTLKRGET
jgi:hypothetical protein